MARTGAFVGVWCIPLLLVTVALAEDRPIRSGKQLSNVRGYWLGSMSGQEPTLDDLPQDLLMAAVRTRLQDANLLTRPGPGMARLHVTVVLLAEHGGRQGWWACLQVREAVRLVREAEGGPIPAVTWYQCASDVTAADSLADAVSTALGELTDRLILAHGKGGEDLP